MNLKVRLTPAVPKGAGLKWIPRVGEAGKFVPSRPSRETGSALMTRGSFAGGQGTTLNGTTAEPNPAQFGGTRCPPTEQPLPRTLRKFEANPSVPS